MDAVTLGLHILSPEKVPVHLRVTQQAQILMSGTSSPPPEHRCRDMKNFTYKIAICMKKGLPGEKAGY